MQLKNRNLTIIILGTLSAIGPFSIDMYLPGFPAIAADLHTTVAQVSLSLSSFFIGISAGQLLYGPLLDRYGRKKPLYTGVALYVLASLGCAFVDSVDSLIILRFFQAIGGCAGMVAARAVVRDLFPVQESARVFSTLMLVIGVSPIIAPTLGGYLAAHFGWQYIFLTMGIMGALILVAIYLALPESREPDPYLSLRPKPILSGFINVLKQPQFYTYALTGSIASAGLYAYIAGSPYVFMEIYEVSEQQYGWIFALIAFGLIGSSQVNSLLLKKNNKSESIIRVALFCQSVTGLLLLAGAITGLLNLLSTILLIFVFLCCQGYTFPNTSALALAPFSKNAGSASALLGGIQMGMGALATVFVSIFSNHTAIPMAAAMAVCALTSFSIQLLGRRVIIKKATAAQVEQELADLVATS